MTIQPDGLSEPPVGPGGKVGANMKRPMELALGHFIGKRLGASSALHAAELTAIRSAVEDHFERATVGLTAVDVAGSWNAKEALEQYGLRVAMDMMLEGLKTPKSIPGNDWQCPP